MRIRLLDERTPRRYRIEGGLDGRTAWAKALRPGEAAWCELTTWDGEYVASYGGTVWPTAWPALFEALPASAAGGAGGIRITAAGRRALAAAEVGAFRPSRFGLANDRLSRAVSEVRAIARAHEEGAALDAGFDAGEWSGPAHARDESAEMAAALARHGYRPSGQHTAADAFEAEVERRTSGRWLHFNVPGIVMGEEE